MTSKDRLAYNAYMRIYMLKRYHERMQAARDFLGNRCVRCGGTEDLDIDHIDPKKRGFRLGTRSGWNKPWVEIKEELRKCQLLCKTCHGLKTAHERGMSHYLDGHGTSGMYRRGCRCDLCRSWLKIRNQKTYLARQV